MLLFLNLLFYQYKNHEGNDVDREQLRNCFLMAIEWERYRLVEYLYDQNKHLCYDTFNDENTYDALAVANTTLGRACKNEGCNKACFLTCYVQASYITATEDEETLVKKTDGYGIKKFAFTD